MRRPQALDMVGSDLRVLHVRSIGERLLAVPRFPIGDLVKRRKVSLIRAVRPYTLLSYQRLSKLYELASDLERERIDGSFVECGVWNGGSAGVISRAAQPNNERHIWLFDSWEGLPEPTEMDVSFAGEQGKVGMDLGYEEKVKQILFERLSLDEERISIVKGWFENTIPAFKDKIGPIALLHLDCDWYESVRFCLRLLYDNLVRGGVVVIDDYGHWKGCKRAVDEFIESRNLRLPLVKIDYTAVYFRK